MSFGLGARTLACSRHVDDMLSAYADRSLPPATLLVCDQHVAFCPRCRVAVDAERRLLSSLRTAVTPELSSRLESALLGVAAHALPTVSTRRWNQQEARPSPLSVVGRSAPALHRSPVRAALLASLAAGASAAAAWSVGVSGAGPSGASLPVARLLSPAAVANSSGLSGSTSGSSNQAASYLGGNRAVVRIPVSISFTTTFTTASTTVVRVGPWPGVRDERATGRIDP